MKNRIIQLHNENRETIAKMSMFRILGQKEGEDRNAIEMTFQE